MDRSYDGYNLERVCSDSWYVRPSPFSDVAIAIKKNKELALECIEEGFGYTMIQKMTRESGKSSYELCDVYKNKLQAFNGILEQRLQELSESNKGCIDGFLNSLNRALFGQLRPKKSENMLKQKLKALFSDYDSYELQVLDQFCSYDKRRVIYFDDAHKLPFKLQKKDIEKDYIIGSRLLALKKMSHSFAFDNWVINHKGHEFERLNNSISSNLKKIAQYEEKIDADDDDCKEDSVHISNGARSTERESIEASDPQSGPPVKRPLGTKR